MNSPTETLRVALAQMSPQWLDREETVGRVCEQIDSAGKQGCRLIAFGEALVPGYPFWLPLTEGAVFESPLQKEWHSIYLKQAVDIGQGHLDAVCRMARQRQIAVYLGTVERAGDRGGHSLYCSLVYISPQGQIKSVHRKLMPTYEERLCWAVGDGAGLVTHPLDGFTLGGLNCWENWMPLSRAALYAQGANVLVAAWPGNVRNTEDITRFIAREGRAYVLSASATMQREQIPDHLPQSAELKQQAPEWLADGGSAIAGPDGKWLIEPVAHRDDLLVADLDLDLVRRERQNFDPCGHYSRPDVTHLQVDRRRQGIARFVDEEKSTDR